MNRRQRREQRKLRDADRWMEQEAAEEAEGLKPLSGFASLAIFCSIPWQVHATLIHY
jgi:hypothetical protein